MDNFTDRANEIIKEGVYFVPENKPEEQMKSIDALFKKGYKFIQWIQGGMQEKEEGKGVAILTKRLTNYSSSHVEVEPDGTINGDDPETFFKQREENAEDPALKAMGLKPEDIVAMDVAQKLATKPGRLNLPIIGAQAQMNSAYGAMMKKIAAKIKKVASAIK